jgi:hypothetical protein
MLATVTLQKGRPHESDFGTLRREYLVHLLFRTTSDLEKKLLDFRTYFNNHRTHNSLEGRTPDTPVSRSIANLRSFGWQPHCRSLFQTPMALNFSIFGLTLVSGQALQKTGMKS